MRQVCGFIVLVLILLTQGHKASGQCATATPTISYGGGGGGCSPYYTSLTVTAYLEYYVGYVYIDWLSNGEYLNSEAQVAFYNGSDQGVLQATIHYELEGGKTVQAYLYYDACPMGIWSSTRYLPDGGAPSVSGTAEVCLSTATIDIQASPGAGIYVYRQYEGFLDPLYPDSDGYYMDETYIPGAVQYFVNAFDNGCSTGLTQISITDITPPMPTVTPAAPVACSGGTVLLTASVGSTGDSGWFYQWTKPGVGSIAHGKTYAAPAGIVGAIVTYNGCTSPERIVNVTTSNPSPPFAVSVPSCTPGTATLSASGGFASYKWFNASGQLIQGKTTAIVSVDVTHDTHFYVAGITSDGCESPQSAPINVVATYYATIATGSPNCDGYYQGLVGNIPVNGYVGEFFIKWYRDGELVFSDHKETTGGETTIYSNYLGNAYDGQTFELKIRYGSCAETTHDTFEVIAPFGNHASAYTKKCNDVLTILVTPNNASYSLHKVYADGSEDNLTPVNHVYTDLNYAETGTYYLRSYRSGCPMEETELSVNENTPPMPEVAPPSATLCLGEEIQLTATIPPYLSTETIKWYSLSNTLLETGATHQTGTSIKVRIENDGCPGPFKTVTITNIGSAPPSVTGAARCEPGLVTLTASTGYSSYQWYDVSQNPIAGETSASLTIHVNSSRFFYVSGTDANGCESLLSSPAPVTVGKPPVPAIPVISTNTCGTKTITKGIPPPGIGWYWQGIDATGQDHTSPVATADTYQVEGAGTFYLAARDANNCWAYRAFTVDVDPVDVTLTSYDPANSVVQATNSIRILGSDGFHVPEGSSFTARVTISRECNDIYNWTEEILYDQQEQPISRSRVYLTGMGNEMQRQSIDYNSGKVWVSQPLYDNFNTPAASTLPAPILEQDFIYKKNFVISAATGQPYKAEDFDDPNTLNSPAAVSPVQGTLGWYYSHNNWEALAPVTNYPYSRSYIPEGPDPKTSISSGPGDQHRMGSGHEVKSERQLIGENDLDHYLSLRSYFVSGSSMPVTGYKHISTDPDGKQAVSFVDADGRSLASATLSGITLDNWSYSYYNDLGQLVASVAPRGVVIDDPGYPEFVTTYKYDHLGRVIETTSPDEGTSRFVYSTDGKIRFSENEEQRNHPGCPTCSPRFSYTNYDYFGRIIESGEYTSSAGGYIFEPHTTLAAASNSVLLQVDYVGQTQGITHKVPGQQTYISDHTFIEYDYQATDLPAGTAHSIQNNTTGQITKTENAFAKTWYSYDEFGQLSWTKQWIAGLNAYKTIDYIYDYFGNVTQVAYQKDNTAEDFYHYYEYDKNQRLNKVYTSKDAGATKILQAAYYYYLHGPLKRMELGGNLQGVDYVYNIDGSLKLINHPNPGYDPGGDGLSDGNPGFMTDVFGESLEYHANDYIGSDFYAGNVILGAPYTDKYGGLVKAVRWHSHTDNHIQRAYAFTYDNLNQLDNADWGSVNFTTPGYEISIDANQAYQEDVGSYDKNGNIMSLFRKGKTGNNLANFGYHYPDNSNRLDHITTGGDNLSYQYNAIGQMIQQTEGARTIKVKYNVYGLVREIRNGSDKLLLTYQYDDRGNKLVKTSYDPNVANNPEIRSTYYVYDAGGNVLAIYEKIGGAVQLSEVPVYGDSRVAVYKPGANATFYEVADHLGNIRGVIGVSETEVYSANFESPSNAAFQRYSTHDDDLMDHTDAASVYHYSQILTGGYNSQIGIARSMKVSPGDKIKFEAHGKYRSPTDTDVDFNTFAAALTGAFGLSAGAPGDPGKAYNALEDYGTLIAGGFDHSEGTQAPKAYLNILLFDNNYNFVDAAYEQINLNAQQTGTAEKADHDPMAHEVTVTESGYAYVFLSNENPKQVDVHFDDVKITHVHSPIVAGGDFYPYGLAMEERQVTDEEYRYGYQGQFSEKDLTTGMQEFELRAYDPRIGRWLSPDPYGQFASPYLAMGNVPHMTIDPDGGFCPEPCPTVDLAGFVGVEATRIPIQAISTAALTAGLTTASMAIPGYSQYRGAIEVDNRSWFYKNVLEPATDVAHGISRSFAGPFTPNFNSNNLNQQRDREMGEKYVGPVVQFFFGGGGTKKLPERRLSGYINNRNIQFNPNASPLNPNRIHRMSGIPSSPGQLGFKELQALVRSYSTEMNAFFNSGGQTIPDKKILETYKELIVRILNGTGGAPAEKATKKAIEVQTQRLEMINKALETFN